MRHSTRVLAAATFVLGAAVPFGALSACEGCKSGGTVPPQSAQTDARPTLRLYLVSNLAGALEPCGCVKDQLGGFDHFAALVAKGRAGADSSAVLLAGPTFFMDASLDPDKKSQDVTKAEALAGALKQAGIFAFAPGKNDFAAGAPELGKIGGLTGGTMVFANRGASGGGESEGAPSKASAVFDAKSMKVGVIGASALVADFAVPGVTAEAAAPKVKDEAAKLKAAGADVTILLASMGRGEAKRLADAVPELTAIVVGAVEQRGEANTQAVSPENVGGVLVVETANHLQTVTVMDFWKRGGAAAGAFVDATGGAEQKKREELTHRIDDLRKSIAVWEKDPKIAPADIDARKKDVAKLEEERSAVKDPAPPEGKSFFRFTSQEIRTDLGEDPKVKDVLAAYYKKVNDDNRVAFANKKPQPAAKGEASYVGIDACESCHDDPYAVWKGTSHAHAYKTLSDQFKEFNLDCVSCHVTGYDKPGGSTVTAVESLKDVQCEVCHGAGSIHVKSAGKTAMPVAKPGEAVCVSCHHPPHVHEFNAKEKLELVLGPGHGKPKK
jgi:2',3'-cyclic-nucleotide 2'-phosphodiesterase (5'-nucleotidase family)